MSPKEAVKICVFAGEIMLTNGAETYRVEDTMRRILNNLDYASDTFVVPSGIFVSTVGGGGEVVSLIRRVRARSNNLEKVALINQFSRDLAGEKINFKTAYEKLESIDKKQTYAYITRVIASGAAVGSFAFMFGGGPLEAIGSLIIGVAVFCLTHLLKSRSAPNMIINMLAGAAIALSALIIANMKIGISLDVMIIASLMPYVPGLVLTNAVRDIFEEDFLSGLSRLAEAILISLSLAVGVGSCLKMWIYIFGGLLL
ncbi:MAG: threonine/serine exporter family protein [Clostridiales bacterium]|jgi:uncharacterized membrane protein YjjP (DUF1212 family)|nr:threonine/serine exporter family protein [Clostridiales bacterium]